MMKITKSQKKIDDFDVATFVNYDVASFSSWFKSKSILEMGCRQEVANTYLV